VVNSGTVEDLRRMASEIAKDDPLSHQVVIQRPIDK